MTELLNIGIRFALYATLMPLFGVPLFAVYGLTNYERQQASVFPLRRLTLMLASLALTLSILGMAILSASMAGTSLLGVDRATIGAMITETPVGHAWQIRVAALLVMLAIAIGKRETPAWLGLGVFAAGVALASLAWGGHGAAGEGTTGAVELMADVTHLLAAGVWIGALAAFLGLLFGSGARPTPDHLGLLHRCLARFSKVGTIAVLLITASGMVNVAILVGPSHLLSLGDTRYGRLLMFKLVLFGAMILLALANRFRLVPTLGASIAAGGEMTSLGALRRSLSIEAGTAVTILALVAWLGTLEPPTAGH